jgi:hypothetical protein
MKYFGKKLEAEKENVVNGTVFCDLYIDIEYDTSYKREKNRVSVADINKILEQLRRLIQSVKSESFTPGVTIKDISISDSWTSDF